MLQKVKQRLAEHENILTCVLLAVGAALILVALFGKTEHKIGAMIYIVF